MKKYILVAAVVLLAASCGKHNNQPTGQNTPTPTPVAFDGRLQVDSPKDGDTINQSFTLTGKAEGWFEGTVPVTVADGQGNQLYKGSFTLGQDNTTQPVNFNQSITLLAVAMTPTGTLEFDDFSAKDGSVVYKKIVNVKFQSFSADQNVHTYASPSKYGFSIQYGDGFGFATDKSQTTGLSYIPVCDDNMVACIYLIRDTFKATNFDGAGVSVNVDPALTTQVKCYNFAVSTDAAQKPGDDYTINGVAFKTATGGDAGAGHFDNVKVYRYFHNNLCYEISAHVGSTDIGNYPTGTVTQFDENAVWQKLQSVVDSFKFTK